MLHAYSIQQLSVFISWTHHGVRRCQGQGEIFFPLRGHLSSLCITLLANSSQSLLFQTLLCKILVMVLLCLLFCQSCSIVDFMPLKKRSRRKTFFLLPCLKNAAIVCRKLWALVQCNQLGLFFDRMPAKEEREFLLIQVHHVLSQKSVLFTFSDLKYCLSVKPLS